MQTTTRYVIICFPLFNIVIAMSPRVTTGIFSAKSDSVDRNRGQRSLWDQALLDSL